MNSIDRLERRIFLLSGWRRWLGSRGVKEMQRQKEIIKERDGGIWAILVADDLIALEYQRLEFRKKRARRGSRNISRYRERAHLARQIKNDVRLFLRPGGADGELWDETFDWTWYKAPARVYVNQDPDDGSYYMIGDM